MTRELVFIHGRSQQHKDAVALKKEWLDTLGEGLAKSNLTLPISDAQVRFPFYGDTLFDLSEGKTPAEAAEIIVRGDETDAAEKKFVLQVLEEIRRKGGITEEQMAEVAGQEVVERGPLNGRGYARRCRRLTGSSRTAALRRSPCSLTTCTSISPTRGFGRPSRTASPRR